MKSSNNLVELKCSNDEEELKLKEKEISNLTKEISGIIRSQNLKPSQISFKLKQLRAERSMVQEEYDILRKNIFKNFV